MARDVLIRLNRLSTTGKVPANAAVRFEPTVLRADADGYILDDYFDAVMVDGEATVTGLPETDLNWAYKVQIRGHGRGAGLKQVYATWYVHLPAGEGTANFEDLPRIDPKTLTPVNDPDPAWVDAVTAVFSDSISTAVEPAMVTAVDDETSEFRARLNAASAEVVAQRQAVSVVDYGAPGLGVEDETAGILAAIAAANGRPVRLAPHGNHKISQTIAGYASLDGAHATLEVTEDVPAIRVPAGVEARDFEVRASPTGDYTSIAVDFDSNSGYTVVNTSTVDNIRVTGKAATTGAAFGSMDGGVGGTRGVLAYVRGKRLYARRIGAGLRLSAMANTSWMNGNTFEIDMYDVGKFYDIQGECDYNEFSGQLQPSGSTTVGFRVSGNGNDFTRCFVWDMNSYPSMIGADLTGGFFNKFQSNIPRVVGASPTNIFAAKALDRTARLRGKGRVTTAAAGGGNDYMAEDFLGEQDNILKLADKFYTVTHTQSPAGSALSSSFGWGSFTQWNLLADTPVTLTIDASPATFTDMYLIGVMFTAGGYMPDYVKIETESTGGTRTTRFERTNPTSPIMHTTDLIPGSVAKIHYTFSAVAAKAIRVAEFFASSGTTPQRSFLQTNGGTVHGNVEWGATNQGPVVRSADGSRWRLGVDDAGTITTTKLT